VAVFADGHRSLDYSAVICRFKGIAVLTQWVTTAKYETNPQHRHRPGH
jgi:hypothetical protein